MQSGRVSNCWWRENLCMFKETLSFVYEKVCPFIEKNGYLPNFFFILVSSMCVFHRELHFRSLSQLVAVAIRKLATNVEYRTLAIIFGLGRLTVAEIVVETCRKIAAHLLTEYVIIPSGGRLKEVVDEFETFLKLLGPLTVSSNVVIYYTSPEMAKTRGPLADQVKMAKTRGPGMYGGVCPNPAEPPPRRSARLARKGGQTSGQTVASPELPPGPGLSRSLSPVSSQAATCNLSLSYGSPKQSSPFSNSPTVSAQSQTRVSSQCPLPPKSRPPFLLPLPSPKPLLSSLVPSKFPLLLSLFLILVLLLSPN